jgi:uncharacterized cupin superfamily protein
MDTPDPTPPTADPGPDPESDRAQALAYKLIRNFHDAALEGWERPPLYANQGVSLTRGTAARKLGAGFDIVPPGKQSCPYHLHHAQEEMFIVLEGEGTLRVAGERLPIRAGDVITIPPGPEYPHHILNTGSVPLKYLSISTQESPEVCEYPDSGKLMAYGSRDGRRTVRSMHIASTAVDYWENEP